MSLAPVREDCGDSGHAVRLVDVSGQKSLKLERDLRKSEQRIIEQEHELKSAYATIRFLENGVRAGWEDKPTRLTDHWFYFAVVWLGAVASSISILRALFS